MKELAAPCFPLHLLQETAGTLDMAPKFFSKRGRRHAGSRELLKFTWRARAGLRFIRQI